MNTPDVDEAINRLTSSYFDKVTDTPNYKEINVRMEVLEPEGASPLPSVNHRFAKRNPQPGVRVEDKWERSDFEPVVETIRKENGQHGTIN